jgi:hypothetical protein
MKSSIEITTLDIGDVLLNVHLREAGLVRIAE